MAPITLASLGGASAAGVSGQSPLIWHQYYSVFLSLSQLDPGFTSMLLHNWCHLVLRSNPGFVATGENSTGGHHSSVKADASAATEYSSDTEHLAMASGDAFDRLSAEHQLQARMYFAAKAQSTAYLRDLVACHQVSRLKPIGISSYFASYGSLKVLARAIIDFLDTVVGEFEQLARMNADEVANGNPSLLSDNMFIRYHTVASSTPEVMQRVRGDLGNLATVLFTTEEDDAIDEAIKDRTKLSLTYAISDRALVIAGAYLKSVSAYPDEWVQGNRAKERFAPITRKVYEKFFQRMVAITGGSSAMDGAETLEALLESIPSQLLATLP